MRRSILLCLGAIGCAGVTGAAEKPWVVRFEPIYMEAHGHDPHVLNVHEIATGPPQVDDVTAVTMDTDASVAYRVAFEHRGDRWTWGAEMFAFLTSQAAPRRTAAAGSGGIDQVVFEVADQEFVSTGPGQALFYETLEDSDLEMWTMDLYGTRALAPASDGGGGVRLQLGLRLADFDNDHFQLVGIENDSGAFLGSSANYDRMMGPLVGLIGDWVVGRSRIVGYLGQSVVLGSAVRTSSTQTFSGSPGSPTFLTDDTFRLHEDVAIPITELRLAWRYRIGTRFLCGLGASASTWHDVPVPPGHAPVAGGDELLDSATIVLTGLEATLEIRF